MSTPPNPGNMLRGWLIVSPHSIPSCFSHMPHAAFAPALPQLDVLLISEDTDNHQNNMLWSYDLLRGKALHGALNTGYASPEDTVPLRAAVPPPHHNTLPCTLSSRCPANPCRRRAAAHSDRAIRR